MTEKEIKKILEPEIKKIQMLQLFQPKKD